VLRTARPSTIGEERASRGLSGAFFFTDSIPFSAAAFESYDSLVAITWPFDASRLSTSLAMRTALEIAIVALAVLVLAFGSSSRGRPRWSRRPRLRLNRRSPPEDEPQHRQRERDDDHD
jgi:hypothetical protein